MNKQTTLRNGNKRALGGKREGAGRPPDWLKQKCQGLIDKSKLIEFLASVADGSASFFAMDKLGHAVEIGPEVKDRLRAVEMLLDRGYGKPAQGVEVTGASGGPVTWVIKVEGVPNA